MDFSLYFCQAEPSLRMKWSNEAQLNLLLLLVYELNKYISTSLQQAQGRLLNVIDYKQFVQLCSFFKFFRQSLSFSKTIKEISGEYISDKQEAA